MRIISGVARGRKIKALKGMDVRPTADRVKEALFNILGNRVVDAMFLDLFAGTGNVGIEAISRGAAKAVFVDCSAASLKIVKENLKLIGFQEQSEVYLQDAFKAVGYFAKNAKQFNLIFLDPPYMQGTLASLITQIYKSKILREDGLLIAEHAKRVSIDAVDGFTMVRKENYGDTSLSFYIYPESHTNAKKD